MELISIFGDNSLAIEREAIYGALGIEPLPGENTHPDVAIDHTEKAF